MVGKMKHVRQKLHQAAVSLIRPLSAQGLEKETASGSLFHINNITFPPQLHTAKNDSGKDTQASSFPSGIFAGTEITKEALVQTLKFEEPSDAVIPAKKGPEEKKVVKSKRDKMKERRERWLSKITSIKQAREQQAAAARRQTMPVVGDMRPLADALPELSQLLTPAVGALTARHKNRKNRVPVKKKPEPTDFSLMKQSQKRKLLETESSRFSEAVRSLASTSNPLADIGEQLRKRMRQEEEQGPG